MVGYAVGYPWNLLHELVLMVGPNPLLTELGNYQRLESCVPLLLNMLSKDDGTIVMRRDLYCNLAN